MSSDRRRFNVFAWAFAALLPLAVSAEHSPPIAGPSIAIGEQGVATAEPQVAVPRDVTPCVVTLFSNQAFDDYASHGFSYTPACSGPWSQVVFKADFNVTAGRQYDRSASVWIGGVNFYFGTTQEPSTKVSPSWHVERDVTELSAALASAQPGSADLFNIYNSTYNGSISGSAELDFYPVTAHHAAAQAPDQVLSLSADPAGHVSNVNTDGTPLSRSLSLPTNIERAYLDVIAESQSNDEFWYTCGPDALSSLTGCGGSGYRETEVSIDGLPAGFAPVSPWIYTGGIDPRLWRPIPGVQTLQFRPFRVDLTPFAALLSDGQPHTIAVAVVTGDAGFQNNSQYFGTAATLLLYQDQNSTQVTGALLGTQDSGVHPTDNYTSSNSNQDYDIDASARHEFSARGVLNTSHGQVLAAVTESASFDNHDLLSNTATTFTQDITLNSEVRSTSTLSGRGGTTGTYQSWSFPLTLNYQFVTNADGTYTQATSVEQKHQQSDFGDPDGDHHGFSNRDFAATTLDYRDKASDTVHWDANFNVLDNSNQQAEQSYFYDDSRGRCYSRSVTAASGAVTAVSDGKGCSR